MRKAALFAMMMMMSAVTACGSVNICSKNPPASKCSNDPQPEQLTDAQVTACEMSKCRSQVQAATDCSLKHQVCGSDGKTDQEATSASLQKDSDCVSKSLAVVACAFSSVSDGGM